MRVVGYDRAGDAGGTTYLDSLNPHIGGMAMMCNELSDSQFLRMTSYDR